MPQFTIRKTWSVNNVPTTPTSITLGIVENDNNLQIVAAGTPMTQEAVGVYEYTAMSVNGGTTYTVTVTVLYGGETYTFTTIAVPEQELCYPHGFQQILDNLMSLYAQLTLCPNPTVTYAGRSVQKAEYLETLGRQIEQMTKLRSQAQPFEVVNRGG